MGDLLENLPSLGNFAHAPEGRALAAGCVSGRAARRRAATRPRETRARLPPERVWGEARGEGGREGGRLVSIASPSSPRDIARTWS